MTPREKAAAVVVAGMPAGPGFGGVLVRQWNIDLAAAARLARLRRPGGWAGEDLPALAPWQAASEYRSSGRGPSSGPASGSAPPGGRPRRVRAGARPSGGPLGSRHFARPEFGVAFARGLGRAACAKHFPGLGSTPRLDRRGSGLRRPPHRRILRPSEQRSTPAFRRMVGHAIHPAAGLCRRLARAQYVPPAAAARLRGGRRHRLAGRPPQPVCALLGAPGADRGKPTWC